jgi:hypothetical protein
LPVRNVQQTKRCKQPKVPAKAQPGGPLERPVSITIRRGAAISRDIYCEAISKH